MRIKSLSILFAIAFLLIFGKKTVHAETTRTITTYNELDNDQIYYGFNKVYPSNNQLRVLNKFIQWSKNDANIYLSITAHTDAIGDREVNLKVSKLRANIIANYLKRNGVADERIIVEWMGEDAPMNENQTPEQRRLNRRTTVQVIKKVYRQEVVQTPTPPVQTSVPHAVITPPKRMVKKMVKAKAPVQQMKTIHLVDAITGKAIEADFELKTKKGKQVFKANEKGELKVDLKDLSGSKAEIYAYGYFYSTEKIHVTTSTQTIRLKPIATGNKLALNNLFFESGKSIMLSESNEEMNKLFQVMKMNKNMVIEIGGHINVPYVRPDNITKEQRKLSTNRAKAVFDYLVENGIEKNRLSYKGYGNSEMVFPQAKTEYEKSKNRRVEIKILEK